MSPPAFLAAFVHSPALPYRMNRHEYRHCARRAYLWALRRHITVKKTSSVSSSSLNIVAYTAILLYIILALGAALRSLYRWANNSFAIRSAALPPVWLSKLAAAHASTCRACHLPTLFYLSLSLSLSQSGDRWMDMGDIWIHW